MNWIEEAIQPKPLPLHPSMQTTRFPRPMIKPVLLRKDSKGRVVFREDPAAVEAAVRSSEAGANISVRVRVSHYSGQTWVAIERHELSGHGRAHTQELRAALVRMYTELFEDRCEQTGIPCVNERRKEMKKWLSLASSQTE